MAYYSLNGVPGGRGGSADSDAVDVRLALHPAALHVLSLSRPLMSCSRHGVPGGGGGGSADSDAVDMGLASHPAALHVLSLSLSPSDVLLKTTLGGSGGRAEGREWGGGRRAQAG